MSLAVRVGDVTVTRLAEDLSFGKGLHGPASCSFNYRTSIASKLFVPFVQVHLFDTATGAVVWDGRIEDPGRSVDGDGQGWSIQAVGEAARAEDRTQAYISIDAVLDGWEREQIDRAESATADAGDVPSQPGVEGLILQYVPSEVIDSSASIVMVYRAIERAGQEIGAFKYTVINGHTNANMETRSFVLPGGLIHTNTWSTTATSRDRNIGAASGPIPDNATRIELTSPRTGVSTTVPGTDVYWTAFYNVVVWATRYNADGTRHTTDLSYKRDVYPHEIVADLLGSGFLDYDGANAEIDTTSTHGIDQFAYPDGVTAAQILEDLMALEPNYYWQVGPDLYGNGPTFKWVKWPTHVRYEFTMADGLDLPGADTERYNRVTVRWVNKKGRSVTQTYNAGTTINGIAVPAVTELDDQGLVRQPEIKDLSTEVGSQKAADKFAAEFLLEHGTPPASGTLTVARRVWDHDTGRFVWPYEIEPGHLGRIRELADDADDLGVTDRDGKSVFRVVGMDYQHSTRSATVELDAPPRTDEELLAKQIKRRRRKR